MLFAQVTDAAVVVAPPVVVVDPTLAWIGLLSAFVTIGIPAITTAVLTVVAMINANRKAKEDARAAEAKAQADRVAAEKAEADRRATASKVEDVKRALVATNTQSAQERQDILDHVMEVKKTGDTTHALVNAAMTAQLKNVAVLSRWKADQTRDPEDVKAADLAEKAHAEHESKQEALNAKGGATKSK